MLLAAFEAGDSFTRAGVTYVHPIAHTLGGIYDEMHGRANAVVLAPMLEAFGPCVQEKLARLARVAGLDVAGLSDAEAADRFIGEIRSMNRAMGIPETFGYIRRRDIPRMLDWAHAEAHPWYRVPRFLDRGELEAVIVRVMDEEEGR